MSARELAAATPATRNRYVDLLRAASIGVVVLGHWMMAVISWEEGKFVGQNLLELSSGFQLLTWVFQVMPVFFIVGGFANAASWDSARRSGIGYADWLRARFARLPLECNSPSEAGESLGFGVLDVEQLVQARDGEDFVNLGLEIAQPQLTGVSLHLFVEND